MPLRIRSRKVKPIQPPFITPEEEKECDKVMEEIREQERVAIEKMREKKREAKEFKSNLRKDFSELGFDSKELTILVVQAWGQEKLRRMPKKKRELELLRKSAKKKIDEDRRKSLANYFNR